MASTQDDAIAELQRANAELLRELRERDTASAHRGSDFDERAAYQAATIDVLKAMSASPGDPRPVFELIVRQASLLCGSANALLFEYDGSMIDCRFIVSSFMAPEEIEVYLRQYPMPLERDPDHSAAVVVRERRVVHVRDADAEPGVSAAARGNGIRSAITVPLIRSGVVAGALTLADTRPGGYSDSQIELLQTFAEQAVIAITSAETYRALQTRTAELATRNTEYSERIDHQAATIDVLQAMSASPGDPQPVFDLIVRQAHELCDSPGAMLGEFDGELLHLRSILDVNADPAALEIYKRRFPMAPMEGPQTSLYLEGREVHIRDGDTDPNLPAAARVTGIRSLAGVPFRRDGKVIGAVILSKSEPGGYSDSQIELLRTFAEQAVIAITSAETYRALQTRTADLQEALEQQTAMAEILQVINASPGDLAPVFETILAKAHTLCGAELGSLGVWDGQYFRKVARYGYEGTADAVLSQPYPPLPLHEPLFRGAVIHAPDVMDPGWEGRDETFDTFYKSSGLRAWLEVPLWKDGTLLGTISGWRREPRAFSDKEIRLLRSFAAQAVIAMENARLITEQEEALEQQTATAEVLQVINASPGDLAPVFQTMLDSALRLCGAAFGELARIDGDITTTLAISGMPAAFSQVRMGSQMQPGPGTTVWHIRHGETLVHIADLLDTEAYRDGDPVRRTLVDDGGARALLAVPLRRDDELLGLISIFRQEPGAFTEKQIALLENFAAQAVIAMENARLLGELRERTDELAERNLAFAERIDHQAATIDVLKEMSASPGDAQPVFELICRQATALLDVVAVALFQYDGRLVHFRAAYGIDSFDAAAMETYRSAFPMVPDRGSMTCRAILDGTAIHIRDVAAEPGLSPAVRALGHKTNVSIPLMRDGKAIGAITTSSFRVDGVTATQVELLKTFAEQAAIAITSAETYRALQTRTADLLESLEYQTATSDVLKVISRSTFDLQPVLDTVVRTAARLCAADQAVFARVENQSLMLESCVGYAAEWEAIVRAKGWFPVDPTSANVSARAILAGHPVHIRDAAAEPGYAPESVTIAGQRTSLGVPLLRDGVPVGVLVLARYRVEPFTERQIELVNTFADQALIAIENTRLITEQREALEQQTATAEVLEVINSSPGDLAPVFDAVLEKALRLCGASIGGIYSYNGRQFEPTAFRGVTPGFAAFDPGKPLTLFPDGILDTILRTRRPVQDPDLTDTDRYRNGNPYTRALVDLGGIRALLDVPLLKDNEVIGVITIFRDQPGAFTNKQIALLENFAAQAVIAMDNARLLDETREALEQQTGMAEVLGVINANPGNLTPVFETILEKAHALCGVTMGCLQTYDGDWMRAVAVRGLPRDPIGERIERELREGFRKSTSILPVDHVEQIIDVAELYTQNPDAAGARLNIDSKVRTQLVVPLLKDGVALGRITAARLEVRPFTERQIALLENFADQAVIAMENARLLSELRERTAELAERNAAFAERIDHQAATIDVLKAMSASPGDAQPVFELICRQARALLDVVAVTLFQYDGHLVHFKATDGTDQNFDAAAITTYRSAFPMVPDRGSLTCRAILDGTPIHIRDLTTEPGLSPAVHALGHKTQVTIPLMRDGRAIGAITTSSFRVDGVTATQIDLLKTFAEQAAIAISSAETYRALQERTAALAQRNTEFGERIEQQSATIDVLKVMSSTPDDTQPVFDQIVRRATELCNGLGTGLFEFDGELVHFRALYHPEGFDPARYEAYAARFPMAPTRGSISCRAILDKQIVHIRDTEVDPELSPVVRDLLKTTQLSQISIPLMRDGQAIGAISLGGRDRGGFTDSQVALLRTFAEQAVIAITSVANFRALRERTDELARRQNELRVTFENMGDGVAMFDETQHLAAWNRKFQDILDVPDEIIARRQTFTEYARYLAERGEFGPDADVDEQVRRLLETGGQLRVFERVRPNGRVIEVRSNPVAGGGFVLIYADITERKRNEAEIAAARDAAEEATRTIEAAFRELKTAQANLIQAEKMASLGQLTAGIAHEIKNPLNFVNNFAELSVDLLAELKEAIAPAEAALNQDQRDEVDDVVATLTGNLKKINEHGKRADGIVKAMLEHSRGASGERRTIDINVLTEEALSLAYHGARAQDQSFNITLEHDFGDGIAPIEVNPQDITRVLLNLFSNGFYAAKKRAESGAEAGFNPTLKVATRAVGDTVEIRVRDNGTGIPPDIRDKLFQPFFTTKPTGEGTGLGLSITYDIVTKAHGGTITVDSEVNEFTEFVVTLPSGMFANEGGRA